MDIYIENIRSFSGVYQVPIRPLTILTGENSTGKSTFMASLSAVLSNKYPINVNFNEPPYELGGYDTIATYCGGKLGRAKYFSLGKILIDKQSEVTRIITTYVNEMGQSKIHKIVIENKNGNFIFNFDENGDAYYDIELLMPIFKDAGSTKVGFKGKVARADKIGIDEVLIYSFVRDFYKNMNNEVAKVYDSEITVMMEGLFEVFNRSTSQALSVAPIRTKPRRTYDQVIDVYSPEGNHIPFVLAKSFYGKSSVSKKNILSALNKFGRDSGLFKEIKVRQLGKNIGDPFQIYVHSKGQPANLLDVGYGVSQAIPIIVQSALLESHKYLLLQQPEVHLHPRAQAALGSFYVDMVNSENKNFIIETHSDYIIDRIRIEVASGKIKSDAVQILYFEKDGYKTKIYTLKIDDNGNIVNAPSSYRDFFLKEDIELLRRIG